jgi:hypothetical protein
MMNQAVKASLDLFIAVAILIAFGQDVYKLTFNTDVKPTQMPTNINATDANTTDAPETPQM